MISRLLTRFRVGNRLELVCLLGEFTGPTAVEDQRPAQSG